MAAAAVAVADTAGLAVTGRGLCHAVSSLDDDELPVLSLRCVATELTAADRDATVVCDSLTLTSTALAARCSTCASLETVSAGGAEKVRFFCAVNSVCDSVLMAPTASLALTCFGVKLAPLADRRCDVTAVDTGDDVTSLLNFDARLVLAMTA